MVINEMLSKLLWCCCTIITLCSLAVNITNISKPATISQSHHIQMSFLRSFSVFVFQFMVIYSLNCCVLITEWIYAQSFFQNWVGSARLSVKNVSGKESQGSSALSRVEQTKDFDGIFQIFAFISSSLRLSKTWKDATSQTCPSPKRTKDFMPRIADSVTRKRKTIENAGELVGFVIIQFANVFETRGKTNN